MKYPEKHPRLRHSRARVAFSIGIQYLVAGSKIKEEILYLSIHIVKGISMNFKVKLEQDEDGYFVVTVPSLPGCISQGKTEKEALRNIKEAIELHISALAEDGIPLKEDDRVKETIVSVNV